VCAVQQSTGADWFIGGSTVANDLTALSDSITRWRSSNVDDYWVRVDYIGSALNRMGNHVLTQSQGSLWHQWHGEWRRIEPGSDFWLFSVPGAFAWTREMLTAIGDAQASDPAPVQLRFSGDYGFVELLRVKMPERDAVNFTFEVKEFGVGVHPDFNP
jgi:hypothetical protein